MQDAQGNIRHQGDKFVLVFDSASLVWKDTFSCECHNAIALVKKNDKAGLIAAYGDDVLDTVSQLIRSAIIAPKGCMLVDADFSAIEARVISWLANEKWRLDVFRSHGKIYEASASQMFNVPIERIKKGNPEYELRAKGKIAELALSIPKILLCGLIWA